MIRDGMDGNWGRGAGLGKESRSAEICLGWFILDELIYQAMGNGPPRSSDAQID
jgi:hypothetical protein